MCSLHKYKLITLWFYRELCVWPYRQEAAGRYPAEEVTRPTHNHLYHKFIFYFFNFCTDQTSNS